MTLCRYPLGLSGCLALILLAAPTNVAGAQAPSPPSLRRPNIILILADDLGYGDLGCYGQKRIQTPNLDALASEGIRFTSCYAGSAVSAPSRAALLTGLHTGHVRIRGDGRVPLERSDTTVAEVLWRYGYRTAAIGKWALGPENTSGIPNKKGFDEWLGYLESTDAQNYFPELLWRNEKRLVLEENRNGAKGVYAHDLFTRAATNFVRSNRDHPFFLYLAYTIPHANSALQDKGMEVPSQRPYAKEDWPEPEKNKAAVITRLDADVGKLVALLKALRIEHQTILFFTSDNGPHQEGGVDPSFFQSAGPWRGIKRQLYEGGLRVPMIVRWPGIIKGGRVSDFPWAFWDFMYTAADLADVTRPEDLDGLSILPTLLGKEQKPHEFFYWELHENGFQQAVRTGAWKAVRSKLDAPLELYQLETDPREKTNVAAAHPEITQKIEAFLKTARTDSLDWPVK
jgi:arylsulfatase A-like enzyme